MLKKILLFCCILSFMDAFSQVFKGKVYGQDEVLENVLVQNKTRNIQTLTDARGNFEISASINDSIVFSNSFFEPQRLLLDSMSLDSVFVVELEGSDNELETIQIASSRNVVKYDPILEAISTEDLIKKEIIVDPWAYIPPPPTETFVNFAYLGKKLIDLIIKKKDLKAQNNRTITRET